MTGIDEGTGKVNMVRSKSGCDEKKQKDRIEHAADHLRGGWNIEVLGANILGGVNVFPSLLGLESYAIANAVVAWYVESDLDKFRAWCRTAAVIWRRALLLRSEPTTAYAMYLKLKWVLLSNDKELVEEVMILVEGAMSVKKQCDPKTDEHFVSTLIHAWRGNWEVVKEKCDQVSQMLEKSNKKKRLTQDYNFLYGMAAGDEYTLNEVIMNMLGPTEMQKNDNFETGFNADLFSSRALIGAKIAWFHGMKVVIESELLPVKLLPWETQPKALTIDFIAATEHVV
nr:hypothetical protein [uncultured Massilia sp.]